MKSISHKPIARVVLLLVLALADFIVAETPASARLVEYVDQNGLQSRCANAGGYYSASGHSYFCVSGGNVVICSDYKKHFCVIPARSVPPTSVLGFPVGPATNAMVTIPCDPIFCKIYCGGRPFCTFGDVSFTAMPVKAEDSLPPGSLVTPVPGGGSGMPASAVPVLE